MDAKYWATQIVNRLVKAGHTAYFAGGWVRDYVMDHPSSDIDIATDAPSEKILDLFPHTILVGLAFGVVIVVMEGHQFEVSTFRKDLHYEGGRRPAAIEFSDAREDALRRDFTINGMFYDPLEGKIIDLVGGMSDIENEVIRTIGDPQERFREDRLRMIRAIRFATRFGFKIDFDTQEAIIENANTLFPPVAMERVWQEFNKMASYANFDHAIIELHRMKLLPEIFPQLEKVHLRNIKQRVASFSHFPKGSPTIFFVLELFPELDLKEQIELCKYLKVSNQEIKLVEYLNTLRSHIANGVDPVTWSHYYAHPAAFICLESLAARMLPQDRKTFINKHLIQRESLQNHVERIVSKKPLVSAKMLQEQGILPGIQMGKLLKEAERIAILKDLEDPQSVLNLLKKDPLWKEYKC